MTHGVGVGSSKLRSQHGEAGLLKRTIASDATYSVAGNRIASRGTAASWAKGLALRTRPQGDRCGFPHRRAGSRKQPYFAVRGARMVRSASIGANPGARLDVSLRHSLRSRSGKRRLLPRTSSMMGCCWDSLNRRQDSCWSRLCGRNHIAVRTDADAIEEI